MFNKRKIFKSLFISSIIGAQAISLSLVDSDIANAKEKALSSNELNVNMNEVPYISSYYIKPIVKPGEDVIIDFYLSDYHQKSYKEDSLEDTFTVTIRIEGKDDIVKEGLKAGDNSINIGSFSKEGEVKYSIVATDQYGRNSHELFNFFMVRNDKVIKKYIMTEEDLRTYNIKNTDDYENIIRVDIPSVGINATIIETAMNEAYNDNNPLSNTYSSIRVSIDGSDSYNNYWKYNKVKYSTDYNKEAVLAEATATREGIQRFIDDKSSEGYNEIVFLNGTYRIDHAEPIYIPSNTTINLNQATIKLNQFTGSNCTMININNAFDAHVVNGIIEGDYYTHDYQNSPSSSEWVNGIEITGESKYSSYEDLVVKNIAGYGGENGIGVGRDGLGYTYYNSKAIGSFSPGDIDRENGNLIESTNRTVSDFINVSDYSSENSPGYIQVGNYLGYQGNPANTWNIVCHFYDSNKNYIESIDGYLYRRVGVPDNSAYMRVTILKESYPTSLNIFYFRVPTHCSFKRVIFENCRAVGLAQAAMKDMLVEDCEFSYSGQTLANCAYDAEDGWDMMQDVTLRGLSFHDNPMNELLTCAGHNFVVEDMVEGKLYIWERTNSFVFRNSESPRISVNLKVGTRVRSGYYRIYNNEIDGGMGITDAGGLNDNWSYIIKNSKIKGNVNGPIGAVKWINCELFDGATGVGEYENCYVHDKAGENQGGKYINSVIENISKNIRGDWDVSGGEIKNFVVAAWHNNAKFSNVKMKNFSIKHDYWFKGSNTTIKNCNIENTDYLIKLPHYAMSKPITIENNYFKSTTSDGMIWFYDDRVGGLAGEAEPQEKLILKNNTIEMPNSKYAIKGLTANSNNYLTIHMLKNIYLYPTMQGYIEDALSAERIVIIDDMFEESRRIQEAFQSILKAESTNEIKDIERARELVNLLLESSIKDQLGDRLNSINSNISIELKTSTSNMDVYIKSENVLLVSLDTTSVTFEDFSGVENLEKRNAVNITVSSSLPYKINSYLTTAIENSDKKESLSADTLNIKTSESINYTPFVNLVTPIVLADEQPAGNNKKHTIDLMLKGNESYKADIYKAVIKFEIEQK